MGLGIIGQKYFIGLRCYRIYFENFSVRVEMIIKERDEYIYLLCLILMLYLEMEILFKNKI